MKSLIQAAVVATILSVPALSFAQSDAPVTRAQVKAELIQFEQASPRSVFGRDPSYPADTQAAQTRVAAQTSGNTQAYGGTVSGASASGSRAETSPIDSVYFGH